MSTNSEYHHGDLRRALMDAALEELESAGVHALSLRTLARRVGVSEAAPYHHFKGKDGLIAALAADGYDRMNLALRGGTENIAPPLERLGAMLRAYAQFAMQHPAHYRVMFGTHIEALSDDLKPRESGRRAYENLAGAAAELAVHRGRPEEASRIERACWAMAHGVATLLLEREFRLEADETPEAVIDDAIAVLLAAFGSEDR